MGRFLQYALAGLSAGSLYALVALGLVLIYRSTRVLNFAHGDLATFGTFVAFAAITGGMSFAIALPVAILVGAVIAVIVLRWLGRRWGVNLPDLLLTLLLASVIDARLPAASKRYCVRSLP